MDTMRLQIVSHVDKRVNPLLVFDYFAEIHNDGPNMSVRYFLEEAKPYGVNWLVAFLFCYVKTGNFRSVRARAGFCDVWETGREFLTYREGVRFGMAGFKDSCRVIADLPNAIRVCELYDAIVAHAAGENPEARDPIVEPPRPPTPPVEDPRPTQPAPEKPKEPDNGESKKPKLPGWLKVALSFGSGVLAASLDKILDAVVFPLPWDSAIKGAIAWILSLFG